VIMIPFSLPAFLDLSYRVISDRLKLSDWVPFDSVIEYFQRICQVCNPNFSIPRIKRISDTYRFGRGMASLETQILSSPIFSTEISGFQPPCHGPRKPWRYFSSVHPTHPTTLREISPDSVGSIVNVLLCPTAWMASTSFAEIHR
jgi:hypothetical protein